MWLLPMPWREQVLKSLAPKVWLNISDVATQVAKARQLRQAGVQRTCRAFAACHTLTSQQACLVLACLQYSREAQVDAVVALWGRIVDKANLAQALVQLGALALHALQSRLGCFNFLRHVQSPFGARFRFDIAQDADQAAAARQLCQSAAAVQAIWQEAHLEVKLERQQLQHTVNAYTETLRRRNRHLQDGSLPAKPESLAELLAAQEALRKQLAKMRPDVRPQRAGGHAGDSIASMTKQEVQHHFARYFRALWDLQEPPAVVLQNIRVDGQPLVGRATVQLQHLWADVAGHARVLELELVPCATLLLGCAVQSLRCCQVANAAAVSDS